VTPHVRRAARHRSGFLELAIRAMDIGISDYKRKAIVVGLSHLLADT